MTMKDKDYVFGPLPKKKRAVFHHPLGFELYDGLAMDLHAMTFAEQCVKAEREACAQIITDAALAAADAGNLREYELLRKLAEAIMARGDA